MAERKSVNKYYPPDWDPRKGSVNKCVGQHPLRDRARKLSQGILIIRFEMPYNIWCGGCKNHIGMGVRYNAEKKKVGNYYTTPIYKFRMKCHLCTNHFEIQTDPKNHDYVIVSGAHRKEQRWDPKENEQVVPEDKDTHKKLATDAMFKLEHGTDDKSRGNSRLSNLDEIEEHMSIKKDDYLLNRLARDKFRTEKKAIIATVAEEKALQEKSSLDIPMLPETEDDIHLAGLMKYRTVESYDEKQKQKRQMIESRPIFQPSEALTALKNKKKTDLKQKLAEIVNVKHRTSFDGAVKSKSDSYTTESLGIRKKQTADSEESTTNVISDTEHQDKCKMNTSGLGLVSTYSDSDSVSSEPET